MAIDKQQKSQGAKISRQKTLLPTLKEQQRYVVYEYVSKQANTGFRDIHNAIVTESKNLLGVFEGAKAGIASALYDEKTRRGIIRVDSKYVDKLKVCLGLIREIRLEGRMVKDVIINPLYVSGMLGKAEQKIHESS